MCAEGQRLGASHMITSLDEITPAWLTAVLQRAGLHTGRVVRMIMEAGETTFCVKAHVRPVYEGTPGPPRIFIKFSRPEHPVTTPESGREVLFHRKIAPAMAVPSLVRCYEAAFDPDQHRLHLVLEDVGETHFSEPASQLPFRPDQAEM